MASPEPTAVDDDDSLRSSLFCHRNGRPSSSPRRLVHETNLIAISDPGQDLDDEMMYMMMRHLLEEGYLDVRGVIATLAPAHDRARLCRGTLNLLGMAKVPVGVGTDGGDTVGKHSATPFDHGARSYMPSANSEEAMMIEPGRKLLGRLYEEAEVHSLTLLIVASFKDAALFLRDNEALFVQKTKEVVIMGGVEPTFHDPTLKSTDIYELPDGTYLENDSSHNQRFDQVATRFFFTRCQDLGIPLVILSRWAAYAAKMPRNIYDDLALSGSSIGRRLRNAQRDAIEQLWSRAAVPPGHKSRKNLPARCDRKWFINTFCGGTDDPARTATDPVWDLVDGFMQYDTMALIASIPSLREKFFEPVIVRTCSSKEKTWTNNMIIGVTQAQPNLRLPKDDLLNLLRTGFRQGLALNHHFKVQVILVVEPREDTVVDMTLTVVMLRTLFELEAAECIGVVVLSNGKKEKEGTKPDEPVALSSDATAIRKTLDEVGLRFVRVLDAQSSVGAADHLQRLYADALPMGVTLCLTTSLTAASTFAERDVHAFRGKTSRVILMGGARQREHLGQWLEPDPDAQNNRADIAAAQKFFNSAQEHSVPLVVLSRFAAHSAHLPRALFDVLASHCGSVGKSVTDAAMAQLEKLWSQVRAPLGSSEHGTLPKRCDKEWFLQTFCGGSEIDEQVPDIWPHISHFNVYSPLALLAVLPERLVSRCLKATDIQVRAATHQVLGWSVDQNAVVDPVALQELLLHLLVYGARCNVSEYSMGNVPAVHVDKSGNSTTIVSKFFDMSEDALADQLPSFHKL